MKGEKRKGRVWGGRLGDVLCFLEKGEKKKREMSEIFAWMPFSLYYLQEARQFFQ